MRNAGTCAVEDEDSLPDEALLQRLPLPFNQRSRDDQNEDEEEDERFREDRPFDADQEDESLTS
jgi:hypothetical protein